MILDSAVLASSMSRSRTWWRDTCARFGCTDPGGTIVSVLIE
jgi:hypothetical protein